MYLDQFGEMFSLKDDDKGNAWNIALCFDCLYEKSGLVYVSEKYAGNYTCFDYKKAYADMKLKYSRRCAKNAKSGNSGLQLELLPTGNVEISNVKLRDPDDAYDGAHWTKDGVTYFFVNDVNWSPTIINTKGEIWFDPYYAIHPTLRRNKITKLFKLED